MPSTEPWLRGTESDVPAVARAVLHALQLAKEDIQKWCGLLSDAQLNECPSGIASVAFHVRHIARSIDRLLTYAEGKALNDGQIAQLKNEFDAAATRNELLTEFNNAITGAESRIRILAKTNLEEARAVGKKQLPTTVGGLLVHVADHTQRHVGQAITTMKLIRGSSSGKLVGENIDATNTSTH